VKVRDLIEDLQELPADSQVVVADPVRAPVDEPESEAWADPAVEATTTATGILVTIEPGEPA
jgi:hypothetical protein